MINEILARLDNTHDRGAVIASFAGMTLRDIAAAQPEDVVDGWSPPSSYDHGRALSVDESIDLLSLADSRRDYAILYLATVMGLRQIEIRRLTWSDVLDNDSLRVMGKGGKRRTVPIGMNALELLPEHGDSPFVFTSYRGGAISESGMRLIISGYLERVTDASTPHALRHTSLTAMLDQGADIRTAMELAGHSSVSSHEVYAATSSSWIVREWVERHPLGEVPCVTVRIPGTPFKGRMARGVERAVLVPERYADDVRAALAYFGNAKQLTNRARKIGVRFQDIRDAGAIGMVEADAHPFLIAMCMGTTPGNVIRRRFDRMTSDANNARVDAVTSVRQMFTTNRFMEVAAT